MRGKYHPIFKNIINAIRDSSKAHLMGNELVRVAFKQCQKETPIKRQMRLALFGFLRFCAQKQKFESTWLPSAATDKDLVNTKIRL